MKVSLEWLGEYVNVTLSPEELADRLDLSGTAVEKTERLGTRLDGVVVGRIKRIDPHPNADRLTYCEVDVGKAKPLAIVCGAPNIKVGQTVPVAMVGAKLPGGFKLERAKIRGVYSEGMMCSETELELGEDSSGIMVLDKGLKLGARVDESLRVIDTVLELEITPNRPDCLGMVGVAREVAALTGQKLRVPKASLREVGAKAAEQAKVDIKDVERCPRYVARVIRGVTLGTAPFWMRRRLMAAGVRPISNVVDVTNYVMMETGQPLHAFDQALLHKSHIIVRRAKKGEKLTTLDDVERDLDTEMLLICDPKGPVALAGVMGGASSEVGLNTKDILLESANFQPVNIARTARLLALSSEASMRFERGVDPNGARFAADRACALIQETAGGEVLRGAVDAYPNKVQPGSLKLRPARANAVLGTSLERRRMAGTLKSLGLEVKDGGAKAPLSVRVPTFRRDLEREIDLIEEVARIHGLNLILSTLPKGGHAVGRLTEQQKLVREVRRILVGAGLMETINYSIISPADLELIRWPEVGGGRHVCLKNPLTEEQSIMRTTLLPGLVQAVRHNAGYGQADAWLFELGRVFHRQPEATLPAEIERVGMALTGLPQPENWCTHPQPADFAGIRGVVETLLAELGAEVVQFRPAGHPTFHPGQCAEVLAGGEVLGILGELHPEVVRDIEAAGAIELCELDLSELATVAGEPRAFRELPRFPGVTLDLAVVVDEAVPAEEVESVIRDAAGKLLKEVRLFDLYRGEQVPPGQKSLAYALVYRAPDRTLTGDEVGHVQERVTARLAERLSATVRSS